MTSGSRETAFSLHLEFYVEGVKEQFDFENKSLKEKFNTEFENEGLEDGQSSRT